MAKDPLVCATDGDYMDGEADHASPEALEDSGSFLDEVDHDDDKALVQFLEVHLK